MSADESYHRRLAAQAGLPYVSLALEPGLPDPVDAHAARRLPAEIARRLRVVAIAADARTLTVAASEIAPEELDSAVRGLTGRALRLVIADPAEIRRAQLRVYGRPPAYRVGRFEPEPPPESADPEFLRRLAESAGLDYTDLSDLEEEVDRGAARLLDERLARRIGAVALSVERGALRVATAQPFDEAAFRVLEAVTGHRVVPVVAPPHRIAAGLERAFAAETRPTRTAPSSRLDARRDRLRLGDLLVASGTIDRASLASALAVQRRTGDPLGRILLGLGLVTPDRLASAIAEQLRLPHAGGTLRADPEAVALLPESLCRSHRMIPLEVVEGELIVAMVDPLDEDAARALRRASRRPTRIVVASEPAILAALEHLHASHYVEISTTELVRRSPEESAFTVLSGPQKVIGVVLLVALVVGLATATVPTLVALTILSILFYFATAAYKFALIYRTIGHEPEIPVSPAEVALLDEHLLPRFTILVPLYHEASVVPGLVRGLDALDYPPTRLDVKLLLEEDDIETIDAVHALALGPQYQTVIVPRSEPKTKPKACNYGLLHARGEYVVIYDAEDRPERDQLKKIVVAFGKASPSVVCIQAKLNYWNREQNLLTRWFTAEYSQWFDLFLPGLDATNAPIPLGGTSNHFKTQVLLDLGAWDPYNVTEDADVGIRLARRGFRTSVINSTTYEEANSRVYNWIRQRSRWIKGYIQTWLVHMRHPVRLWRELGTARWLSFQLVVGGTFMTMLLNPVFWVLTTMWALTEAELIREIFPGPVYFAASANLFIGNFVFTYLCVAAVMRRGYDELVKFALLVPLYWALMSLGAWKGALQLITRPSYWEKTVHGLTPE